MWEDQNVSWDTHNVPEQRIFRCPRLNRQVQSAYRQFRIAPERSDLDEIDKQAAQSDDIEQRDLGVDFPPAAEVQVEATTLFHEAEPSGDDGERLHSEQLEPAPPIAEQPELVSPMGEPRVGLRAIFATESDSTDEMPYTSTSAESDDQEDDHSSAAPRQTRSVDDGLREGLSAQQQASDLVWKSFPKPLQRK